MTKFIVRRLLLTIPVLIGLLLLVFVLTRVVPVDPAAVLAGESATLEDIQRLRTALGLDQPLPVQFWRYLAQVGLGDFGTSLYTHRPVSMDLVERLPATIELALATMLLSVVLGVPLGLIGAIYRNSWLDQILRIFMITGLAVASFWIAIVFQLVFSLWLEWLPLRGRIQGDVAGPPLRTGLYTLDYLFAGQWRQAVDALKHLALPSLTLALPAIATIARFTRSSAIETLQKDFVTWERAIGYPPRILLWKYVLRSSLSATITQIGLLFGLFLSGSIVVEAIFGWPGLGDYIYNAVLVSDYQPVMAATLLIGVIYAVVNIMVDIAQVMIDPRISEE